MTAPEEKTVKTGDTFTKKMSSSAVMIQHILIRVFVLTLSTRFCLPFVSPRVWVT